MKDIENRVKSLEKTVASLTGKKSAPYVKPHVRRSPAHETYSDSTPASNRSKLTVGQVKSIKAFASLNEEVGKLNYQRVAYLMGVHNKTVYDVLNGSLYPDIN